MEFRSSLPGTFMSTNVESFFWTLLKSLVGSEDDSTVIRCAVLEGNVNVCIEGRDKDGG